MALAVLANCALLLIWMIDTSMEDPHRIYALITVLIIWLAMGFVWMGPSIVAGIRFIKSRKQQ